MTCYKSVLRVPKHRDRNSYLRLPLQIPFSLLPFSPSLGSPVFPLSTPSVYSCSLPLPPSSFLSPLFLPFSPVTLLETRPTDTFVTRFDVGTLDSIPGPNTDCYRLTVHTRRDTSVVTTQAGKVLNPKLLWFKKNSPVTP